MTQEHNFCLYKLNSVSHQSMLESFSGFHSHNYGWYIPTLYAIKISFTIIKLLQGILQLDCTKFYGRPPPPLEKLRST